MVVIEPEAEAEESKEAPRAPESRREPRVPEASVIQSDEGDGSGDETFEDALTDEQLKEVQSSLIFLLIFLFLFLILVSGRSRSLFPWFKV